MNLKMEKYLYQTNLGEADYSELSKKTYTVIGSLLYFGGEFLEIGEKVNILKMTNVYFEDVKVKRESGEISDFTLTYADRPNY